jgi:hypothetical protein
MAYATVQHRLFKLLSNKGGLDNGKFANLI